MRIIAGIHKGRSLGSVPGTETRPTTSRVREAWASSLLSHLARGSFEGLRVLDPFAGSGALGFELLSRGAAECLFIEKERKALTILKSNRARLGLSEARAPVCRADSLSPALLDCLSAALLPFDLVVLDPPYAVSSAQVCQLLTTLARAGALERGGLVSYEHAASRPPEMEGHLLNQGATTLALQLVKHKKYGTIALDYYLCV